MRVDWLARLDAAETMVVDDLDDFRSLDALDGLPALVVVDEDDAIALRHRQFVAAHDADEAAVFDDRIVAVIRLLHRSLDVRKEIERLEADGIRMHDAAHRHALVDEARRRVRVIRRREHEDAALFRLLDDVGRDAAVARDDEDRDALLDAVDDRLVVAVANEDDVVLLDVRLDHLD